MKASMALAFSAMAAALLAEKPRLSLDAPRVQALLPGLAAKGFGRRVEVVARLEGDPEDPEEYYCLDQVWEWGDGTESTRENDCDPYENGVELDREFRDTHYYKPGEYEILLRLVRREKTVVKGAIDVRIY